MSAINKINEPWAGHSFAEVESFLKKELSVLSGDFVDLGLPSGNLWASCNLGANSPTESGLYFMWGDIQGHTATEGFNFEWGDGWDSTNKVFDPNGNYGKTAAAKIFTDIPVDARYDAAQAMIGGKAHIPTRGDYFELEEFCTWTWTTNYQGSSVNGYVVTGVNGKSIFMPAAGYFNGDKISGVGSNGDYWASTMHHVENGCRLDFDSGGVFPGYYNRYSGYCLRAVQ